MTRAQLFRNLREVLATEAKFLFFRKSRPDIHNLGNYYLALGLISAWLSGVGRYWDNPRADLWQYLGLGSLAYIFILALIIWALLIPLRPENWSYKSVLTFVGMTAPPGILYAIPVERFYSLDTAQFLNVLFLAVVATWRVILLFVFLRRSAKLSGIAVVVAALLPLVIIVSALTVLNLEHVIFRVMAGLTESERTGNDTAYVVLLLITYLSLWATPFLVTAYGILVFKRWRDGTKRESSPAV